MDPASTRLLMRVPSDPSTSRHPAFDPDYVQHASEERRDISTPIYLTTGTGYSIYTSTIIPAIKAARRDVILATCFWAPSVTRDALGDALRILSRKAVASSTKISVRICFSSASLARNMLLPTPKGGQDYPPSSWKKVLGLPEPHELTGLDLRVVRKFFWPFGIIHSKYVIVDRELAIFPSCNVSWERWFEVAVSMRGPVVQHLFDFHTAFWDDGRTPAVLERATTDDGNLQNDSNTTTASHPKGLNIPDVQTTLLPSPHTPTILPNHLQPRALAVHCPCIPDAPANFSPTPLLKTTYHLLSTAQSSIIMLTPNLTEPTVLGALIHALDRGVNVSIWTNRHLMTMEQLVTAGTTTPNCVRDLQQRAEDTRGRLEVSFFDDDGDGEAGPGTAGHRVHEGDPEFETTPVKLHAKVTMVDDDKILLGSGNMDAASWKTSQELGVLIESRAVVDEFKRQWGYSEL